MRSTIGGQSYKAFGQKFTDDFFCKPDYFINVTIIFLYRERIHLSKNHV